MAHAAKQTTVCIDSYRRIGVLVSTDGDDVKLKFDTTGEASPSPYRCGEAIEAYDVLAFRRPTGHNEHYRLTEHGYFMPSEFKNIVLTIHIIETARSVFNVTINAYSRENYTERRGVDPQYLGSKSLTVGIKND